MWGIPSNQIRMRDYQFVLQVDRGQCINIIPTLIDTNIWNLFRSFLLIHSSSKGLDHARDSSTRHSEQRLQRFILLYISFISMNRFISSIKSRRLSHCLARSMAFICPNLLWSRLVSNNWIVSTWCEGLSQTPRSVSNVKYSIYIHTTRSHLDSSNGPLPQLRVKMWLSGCSLDAMMCCWHFSSFELDYLRLASLNYVHKFITTKPTEINLNEFLI